VRARIIVRAQRADTAGGRPLKLNVRHQQSDNYSHRSRNGGNMTKRLSRIAPWQAGKLFALIYFVMSFLFVIPMALLSAFAPMPQGAKPHLGLGFIICLPFMYALAGLIFVPLGCWVYNTAAKVVGGLEISVSNGADA
jgi:hypothetical protein